MKYASRDIADLTFYYHRTSRKRLDSSLNKDAMELDLHTDYELIRNDFELKVDYLKSIEFDLVRNLIKVEPALMDTEILKLLSYSRDENEFNFVSFCPETIDKVVADFIIREADTGKDFYASYVGKKCKIIENGVSQSPDEIGKFTFTIYCDELKFKIGDEKK